MSKKNTFSLVELLVVIAIIALLSTMLISTISNYNDGARTLQCQENLRNLGLATNSFVGSYGALPSHQGVTYDDRLLEFDGRKTGTHNKVFFAGNDQDCGDLGKAAVFGNAGQKQLIQSEEVLTYVCPDDGRMTHAEVNGEVLGFKTAGTVRHNLGNTGAAAFPRTYSPTNSVYNGESSWGGARPITGFDMPDSTFYLVESARLHYDGITSSEKVSSEGGDEQKPINLQENGAPEGETPQGGQIVNVAPHGDKYNYLFLDFHVEKLEPKETVTEGEFNLWRGTQS